MSDIFVSYAKEDQEHAARIARVLETRGWSVWWDHSIPAGKSYDEVIERATAECRCMIVIWSKHSVNAHWVKTEAGEGLARKILIPVQLDESRISIEFRRIQAASLVGWSGDPDDGKIRAVIRDIVGLIGEPASKAREPGPPPPPPRPAPPDRDVALRGPKWRRRLFWALAVFVTIVGVIAAIAIEEQARSDRRNRALATPPDSAAPAVASPDTMRRDSTAR